MTERARMFPLGFVSAWPVAPGDHCTVVVRPQLDCRLHRFVLPFARPGHVRAAPAAAPDPN